MVKPSIPSLSLKIHETSMVPIRQLDQNMCVTEQNFDQNKPLHGCNA